MRLKSWTKVEILHAGASIQKRAHTHLHTQLQIHVFGAEINKIKDREKTQEEKINHNDIVKNKSTANKSK